MSGAKSRCMPQAASVALTCADSKFSLEPGARRGRAAAAPCRARQRRPSCARRSRRCRRARAPSSASRAGGTDARRSRREGGDQSRHVVGVGRREGGDARRGLFEIGADAEPAAVGEGAGEAIGDRREFQARALSIHLHISGGRPSRRTGSDSSRRNRDGSRAGCIRASGPRRRSSRCARKPRFSSLSSARCAAQARLLWPAPTSMASNSLTPRPAFPLCLKIIADAYVFV